MNNSYQSNSQFSEQDQQYSFKTHATNELLYQKYNNFKRDSIITIVIFCFLFLIITYFVAIVWAIIMFGRSSDIEKNDRNFSDIKIFYILGIFFFPLFLIAGILGLIKSNDAISRLENFKPL